MRSEFTKPNARNDATMRYHFDLVCPRCDKASTTVAAKRIPPPHVNCGDCLMDRVEIIEMKVVRVFEIAADEQGERQ